MIFTVEFRDHLSDEQIANLSGILSFKGVIVSRSARGLTLEVTRGSRTATVATTLKNWDQSGWLKWSSDGS